MRAVLAGALALGLAGAAQAAPATTCDRACLEGAMEAREGDSLYMADPQAGQVGAYSFQIFELFKIKDGKIIRVEAILNTVPYGMRSGW